MDIDEEEQGEDEEKQKKKDEVERQKMNRLPKWALNLDPSSQKIPAVGLVNCDADEVAAQIFHNGTMSNIVVLFGSYYNSRVISLSQARTMTTW